MIDKTRIIIAGSVVLAALLMSFAAQRSETAARLLGYVSVNPAPQGSVISSQHPASAPAVTPLKCTQKSAFPPTHAVIINEVAWAGTAAGQSSQEWIELKNPGLSDVSLAGWQMLNAAESVAVFFSDGEHIAPGEYFLLERGSTDPIGAAAIDRSFSGGIKNSGESLRLFDRDCHVIDEVIADVGTNGAWPAGTAAPDYRTAERSADLSWHTYSGNGLGGVFGTPGAKNSQHPATIAPVPVSAATSSISDPLPAQPNLPTTQRIMISEVMTGTNANKGHQFIELYNPSAVAVDLTGWTIKKRSSTGTESSLVSATRLKGKTIKSRGYFLIGKEGGYTGAVAADVAWPASYSLTRTKNALALYTAEGYVADSVSWDEIPADKSFSRMSPTSDSFIVAAPTPQSSQGK